MISFTGRVTYESEDSGQALIATLYKQDNPPENATDALFVRIQSWQDNAEDLPKKERHPQAMSLKGKKVRVTIEVLE